MHIIGFDVILDKELVPWILEINASPSMSTTYNMKNIKADITEKCLSNLDLHVKSMYPSRVIS